MAAKSKSKQEEALQFLDDLDSLNPVAATTRGPATSTGNAGDPADVLAFIDEITQKSSEPTRSTTSHIERHTSRPGTPSLRKSTERVKVGAHPSSSTSSLVAKPELSSTPAAKAEAEPALAASSSRWGWGSVWTSANTAYQQARSVVDEQVKNLPKNEHISKLGEGVLEYAKTAQLDKIGQDFKRVGLSTLTDILNVVAPPISEHEVIQVWLSHDMKGYDGVESLVYRSLARVMEQVEGGDLIINRGDESKPKESAAGTPRDFNSVDGYDAALKLAQANLDEFIKNNSKSPPKESSVQNPVTYSSVYLRIQPFITSFTLPQQAADASEESADAPEQSNLQFLLHLSDPGHKLVHTTITQAVPGSWLQIWDDYDWVEDLVAESLRVGIEVIGQDYIVARMGWGKKTVEPITPQEVPSESSP
ncbi:maintenance of telomere capping protein 1 [Suillus clintonianus]|uniref:maintenance of telomere capping protein 1 n=1 Tax=Suillus clintonianus TaxID=1904413 RepID=UPI001B865818|nr:maintenance of telomere capping protein 1 [Suillus clintonianus]KAG2155417.1 maintenance of telomere capping protein 1 [Suillus clintonianus]